MKTAVKAGIFALAILAIMLIAMGLTSANARTGENERALQAAVEQTLAQMKEEGGYSVENESEMIADFNRRLLLQVASDSDILVEVLTADTKKGILDVRVTEKYHTVKGKIQEAVCRKTVILEEYTDNDKKGYHTIRFQVGETLFCRYTVYTGGRLVNPGIPKRDGRKFLYWVKEGSELPADPETITAAEDMCFRAVFGPA